MAIDFEKLKSKFSVDTKNLAAKQTAVTKQPSVLTKLAAYPAVAELKRGLEDVQVVAHEGKFNLFVKQIVVLLGLFLLVRFMNGKLAESKAKIKDQVASINIQQANEGYYTENKQQLLRLEPMFPDIEQKNDWMLRRLINIFETHNITPDIDGNFTETTQKTYTMLVQPVKFEQSFAEIGKLIADIENGDDFLRLSEVTISKQTAPEALGKNAVNVTFNTVFPKEKYASKLFKDYAQQIKKIQAEKDATTPQTQQEPKSGGNQG